MTRIKVSNGGQGMQANATTTTLTTQNLWYKVAGTTSATNTGIRVDNTTTSNKLIYKGTTTTHFHVVSNHDFTCSANNQLLEFELRKNGTVSAPVPVGRKVSTGTDQGAMSVHTDTMLDTDDYIELWARNTTSSGTTITVVNMYLFIMGMFN